MDEIGRGNRDSQPQGDYHRSHGRGRRPRLQEGKAACGPWQVHPCENGHEVESNDEEPPLEEGQGLPLERLPLEALPLKQDHELPLKEDQKLPLKEDQKLPLKEDHELPLVGEQQDHRGKEGEQDASTDLMEVEVEEEAGREAHRRRAHAWRGRAHGRESKGDVQ